MQDKFNHLIFKICLDNQKKTWQFFGSDNQKTVTKYLNIIFKVPVRGKVLFVTFFFIGKHLLLRYIFPLTTLFCTSSETEGDISTT